MNRQSLELLLNNFLEMDSKKISSIMLKVSDVPFLDINDSRLTLKEKITKSKRTFYPVCSGNKENIIGIIHIKELLVGALSESKIDLTEGLHEPMYFNEDSSIHQVYDIFFQSKIGAAFIVDKENNVTGFVTLKEVTNTFLTILG